MMTGAAARGRVPAAADGSGTAEIGRHHVCFRTQDVPDVTDRKVVV